MATILDTVRQQLDPNMIQQISQSIGADPAATSNAISVALPALLSGLSHNASKPQGAAALDSALDAHDGSILNNLGGLLGGGGAGAGAAILGHIFGARRGPVEQGVGQASGLDAARTAQLLAILAPIVMGVLGRMKQNKDVDAARLPDVLNSGREQAEKDHPGLGGMFDMNKDGNVADDLLRMGSNALGGIFGKR
ncbi:MAG TPA: DUF937 domain-containing protein [Thermoanaerobaculia bacterium]|jgi:hypothetical protein